MDKYVLVEYLSTIKCAISETFKNTLRIKIISFDVSNQYIILGTSSGGIYIFKRSPCEFLRLIPSKEGPTVLVKISPNEKHLSLASSKGLIITLEDCFVDFNLRPFVYSEHEGNTITAMQWHGNDLYSGDNTGKISICCVTSTLTQVIFQSSSSVLMQLDSSIVQIDAYKNYLLISTKTRTYLCDTEKEQYKQIGKKPRDGMLGACFSQHDSSDYLDRTQRVRKAFRTLEGEETFDNILSNNDVKIYCARPGARLWSANFDATVLSTYQFRNSLNQYSSNTLLIENSKDARLRFSNEDSKEISEDVNFGKLYSLTPNIIVTYDNKGIYFFNTATNKLLSWTHIFKNIKSIVILKPYIYVWSNDLHINIITLCSLEELIISILFNKQYFLCTEICIHFEQDVLQLIEYSKKINLLSILDTKLNEMNEKELLEKIKNILYKLKDYYTEQKLELKVENGVVVINNEYSPQIENHEISSPVEEDLKTIYKQYVLNKTHKLAELTESSKLLSNLNLNELPIIFESFTKYVREKHNEDSSSWCEEQMVNLVCRNLKLIENLQKPGLDYLSKSFLNIHNYEKDTCYCKFPLPISHTRKIQHFELACKLYEYSEEKNIFLTHIPSLYKYILKRTPQHSQNLSLLVQFSDKEVYKNFFGTLTYDSWDEILKLFTKLQTERCLRCGEKISLEGSLSWTDIGKLIVESIGSQNAVRLLKRYSEFIPKGHLNYQFYQNCIFSLVAGNGGKAVEFIEETTKAGNMKKFTESMQQFLQKKYSNTPFASSPGQSSGSIVNCAKCQLPINNPILTEFKRCQCGNVFHQICLNNNNNICQLCVNLTNN